MADANRPLRVAWLYPLPKRPLLEACRRGEEPDQLSGIDAIRAFGIEPELVDPLPGPWNPFSGRHSLYSGIDPLRALRLLFNLRRYDVILAVGESSALVLVAMRALFRFKIPILVWDPALGSDWTMRRRILDFVLPRVDRILVVGTNQVEYLHHHHPSAAPASAILHWEDTAFFKPMPEVPVGNYILTVGNDVARDFDTLIAAAEGLEMDVVIKTRRHIDSPLPRNVRVISERISFRALRELYAGARMVVVPLLDAVHASGVNGILEAFSMGRPTIASDIEGIRDFIRNGETVLTVPPGDAGRLRRAIETLRSDNALAEHLAAAGRREAEDRYALDAFAARLAAELRAAWCMRQGPGAEDLRDNSR